MNRKIKIAVIGLKGLPAFGGAATVGENIIEQLKDQYDFTVYSVSSHTHLKTGEYNGYKQIVFQEIKSKKINTLLYYIKSMFGVLFGSYDLVHLHHRDAAFIIPFLRLRAKVVLTTHGMVLTKKWAKYKSFFDFQDKVFLGFANRITTVSLKDYSIVFSILGSEKKLEYIPNGVNLVEDSYADINDSIVFAAGRIVPDKGCHVLLKALANIDYKGTVIIIGDLEQIPTYKLEIESLASKLQNVVFTGLIKEKNKLNDYIKKAKLFVYPSEIESMSMMMLEVASFKVPMLCCNISENRDVFDDKEVLYFETSNADDLAKKLEWANVNYSEMKLRSENAFNHLEIDYLWKDIAVKYDEVYLESLSKQYE